MEIVAGFFLWLGEILGINWIKKERNTVSRILKGVTFFLVGFVAVILYLVFTTS